MVHKPLAVGPSRGRRTSFVNNTFLSACGHEYTRLAWVLRICCLIGLGCVGSLGPPAGREYVLLPLVTEHDSIVGGGACLAVVCARTCLLMSEARVELYTAMIIPECVCVCVRMCVCL